MKILVIRTDNIGDLVCTTPLLTALRDRYPEAWVGVLANSYSGPVLYGHPAVNEVFEYRKIKHLDAGQSALGAYWHRLCTVLRLRAMHFDLVLIPAIAGQSSALRFARWLNAKQVIVNADSEYPHEVEKVYAIERLLPDRLPWPPPPCSVVASPPVVAALAMDLGLQEGEAQKKLRVGLHISARKPSQRWPAASFITLARQLASQHSAIEFLLFWSPGKADDPKHPGDDEKAQEIINGVGDCVRLVPVPTTGLPELIAGLSLCDVLVQSDGGAMHIAAGLGKPIVCFFGQSSAERWHPWRVPHVLMQKSKASVECLEVEEVLASITRLCK